MVIEFDYQNKDEFDKDTSILFQWDNHVTQPNDNR